MAFKSLKRFETEIVRMTANMLHGDQNVVGTITSGGTESCLLAVKTYRDRAQRLQPRIRRPEMILPESIHVAFEKAAEYFKVRPVHVPVDSTGQVNLKAVRKRINRNTILLVGSAPSYPHGAVDPIAELGQLAQRKKLPLHVDACLGGFMLPWVEKLGHKIPAFDFRIPGVWSISADIHKYGFAAKGASVVLYRNVKILQDQFFVFENWPGGVFASPALLGTRPGGAIAAAWAVLQILGESGYMTMARETMVITKTLQNKIEEIEGLKIVGKPHMSVFAYRSTRPDLNIFAVADRMEVRGWHIDRLQRPDAIHAMVTPAHSGVVDTYLDDLKESVQEVIKNPKLAMSGGAATYGMISKIPLRGMIRKTVLKMMMDMYGPDGILPDLKDSQKQDLAMKLGVHFLKLREKAEKWWHSVI